jgi:hypothetical protein
METATVSTDLGVVDFSARIAETMDLVNYEMKPLRTYMKKEIEKFFGQRVKITLIEDAKKPWDGCDEFDAVVTEISEKGSGFLVHFKDLECHRQRIQAYQIYDVIIESIISIQPFKG